MSLRLLGAPWWVRCLVWSCFAALVVALMWGLSFPYLRTAAGVGWSAAGSLAIGALMATRQQPAHRAYTAAVTGLSSAERSQAVRSLCDGEIPTDPEVLGAAMELAEVAAAGRNPSRAFWLLRLMFLASWAVAAISQFAVGNVTAGVVWTALGLVVAGSWAWDRHYLRRLQIRYALIGEAVRASAG